MRDHPTVAVTIGDPAGIGPEIVVRAIAEEAVRRSAALVVVGDGAILERAATVAGVALGLDDRTTLIDLANVPADLPWGQVRPEAGRAAAQYVERAVAEALAGRVDAIATAPLNKEALWAAGYAVPGHTELLGQLTGVADPLTMFQVRGLRIFFLTRHHSLREALARITRERLMERLPRIDAELRRLGFDRPRLAVAALNPHAGEGGALGTEERDIIAVAVREARARGLDVSGPVPADAVFAQALEGRYDAVLSLYHDQGHIAAKTLDFHGTVSVTLGLPFIRTSVDHGTAFDIAGRGIARADSMAAAIIAAADLVRRGRAAGHLA
ncbi:MAG TPA: 4-hydroxythreonine-4-phosphate dehydrogenase PdxA [bacterium]|nr:4-hydroxythreonine-4-phosphate dehydrogenase PdxA [bacterium]